MTKYFLFEEVGVGGGVYQVVLLWARELIIEA
jgi:hypothetical protein